MGLLLGDKALAVLRSVQQDGGGKEGDVLKGFIVSDAHVGYEKDIQPSPARQKELINAIRQRFPCLDIFIDTGDAHHNGRDRNIEKGDWTDNIAYQDLPVPLMYVPGNHEISHVHEFDVEESCNMMGSHECRPYYSYDIKGIHFVSVPELMRTVYITQELLDWLALDLEINKDKTTILLSHNNLIGYSKTYNEGYRGVVNTHDIIALMERYPNCVAWMYGHNHNYEVIEKKKQLFVSNGRLGGFDPSKGVHGLGGIYFELSSSYFKVQCYSAEFGKFVHEIDNSEVFSAKLDISTSLDASALPSQSFGVGRARNGEKRPVYHHHVSGNGNMEVFLAGVGGKSINEDPTFKYYMVRSSSDKKDRQLMGCTMENNTNSYEWRNPGVFVLPNKSDKPTRMTLPRTSHNRFTYYRASAGQKYRVVMDMEGMGSIVVTNNLFDRDGGESVQQVVNRFTLAGKRQKLVADVHFTPEKKVRSIYTDENSDNVFNFSTAIEFLSPESGVMVHSISIEFAGAAEGTQSPSLKFGESLSKSSDNLGQGEMRSFSMPARAGNRTVVTVGASGNGMATWLVRQRDLQWQVLGARVEDRPSSMLIGPMRNLFSHRKEVAINPYGDYRMQTFVSRLRNVDVAEVFPLEKGNEQITVKVLKTLSGKAEIEVFSFRNDLKVSGGEAMRRGNKYMIPVIEGANVTIITL